MSSFLVNLWESIFTPGPTPTLLLATNATFGTLQLLLLVLLITTASIHFGILSILCAGLWYSINWFAREVQAAKAAEDASGSSEGKTSQTTRQASPDPTGSDTETEADPVVVTGADPTRTTPHDATQQRRKPPPPQPGQAPMPPPTAPASGSMPPTAPATSFDTQHLQPKPPSASPGLDGSQDLGRRRRSLGESSGYVSTDSEWEKVSDQEGK